jgi:transcriptional regulator with XRE-family HTH domain
MSKKQLSMRELREKAGLSLIQLSVNTDIPYSTVQALEAGRGKGFSPATKHRISDYFQVNFFSLFPEERDRFEAMQRLAFGPTKRKK